jgi:cytochrome c553
MRRQFRSAAVLTTLALLVPPPAAMAQARTGGAGDYAKRFASECAGCHGADGKSGITGTPHLAGQHSYYVVTQLFLFREGRRDNQAMTAVAKTLKDDDLRGFSDFIGTLPALPAAAPAEPLDEARMSRGRALAEQQKCLFCHGEDMSGGQQVPRVAGQREEYLRESLEGYRTRTRLGYTRAMLEPMSGLSAEDAATLAYFAAHLPAAAAGRGSK